MSIARRTYIYAAAFALCAAAVITPASAQDRRPSDVPAGELAEVTRVNDARTLTVALNGKSVTVSLLGIDAPAGNACFAGQAKTAVTQLLSGKLVKLQSDPSVTDAGGVLSRYVYRIDGYMAQEELLKAGLAKNAPANVDALHVNAFITLEGAAQRGKKGGWAKCNWAATPVVTIENGCRVLQVERLSQPIDALPELVDAANGACVTIIKPANAASGEWSGQFVYRPKGSVVQPGTLYVRWKDAFVLVNKNSDGELVANVVENTYKSRVSPRERDRYQSKTPGLTRISIQRLERPDTASNVLRIPNPQTNLFQDAGNGQLTALVDVFEYVSGEARVPRRVITGEFE